MHACEVEKRAYYLALPYRNIRTQSALIFCCADSDASSKTAINMYATKTMFTTTTADIPAYVGLLPTYMMNHASDINILTTEYIVQCQKVRHQRTKDDCSCKKQQLSIYIATVKLASYRQSIHISGIILWQGSSMYCCS